MTLGMAVHFVLAGWLTYGLPARSGELDRRRHGRRRVRADRHPRLTDEPRARRQALRLGADAARLLGAPPGHPRRAALGLSGRSAWWSPCWSLGHYQMSYFLLMALGLWTLYLAFWVRTAAPAATCGVRWHWRRLAPSLLGIGITGAPGAAVPGVHQVLAPRRRRPNTGWAWVTSYAMPPAEVFTTIPAAVQWRARSLLGLQPVQVPHRVPRRAAAGAGCFALGDRAGRRLVVALADRRRAVPAHRLRGAHAVLPACSSSSCRMLKKMRALGMVFFLVAFLVVLLAGLGLDRSCRGEVSPTRGARRARRCSACFALLGVVGVLQAVAEALALPERMAAVAGQCAGPAGRRSAAAASCAAGRRCRALGGGGRAKLRGAAGGRARWSGVTAADLWSVDRLFFDCSRRGRRSSSRTTRSRASEAAARCPIRVFDPGVVPAVDPDGATASSSVLGYHGNELRSYEELGGQGDVWRNLLAPNPCSTCWPCGS